LFLFLLRTSAKIKQAYLCARFVVGFRFIYNLVILQFSSLRLAFEKSDSLRGFESPLLQADAEGASVATTAGLSAPRSLACEPLAGGRLPLSLVFVSPLNWSLQFARCLQAPLPGEAGERLSPFLLRSYDIYFCHIRRLQKSAKDCKRLQKSAK
jgi:hypothetical protein